MWSMVLKTAERSSRVRAVIDPLAILKRISFSILRRYVFCKMIETQS